MTMNEDNGNWLEAVRCDSCGADGYAKVYEFHVSGCGLAVVRCAACGLHYLNPRPTTEALARLYGENYYSYRLDDDGEDAAKPADLKERLRASVMHAVLGYPADAKTPLPNIPSWAAGFLAANVAVPAFKPGGRLLDVGCGAGEKLLGFKSLGWDVYGLEFSEVAALEGAKRGLQIDICGLDAAPHPDGFFQAVTFYHSLEHLPSPARGLAAARRLLAPGGQALIVVPNFGSLERRVFGKSWGWMQIPFHFYHFDKKSLPRMILEAGFAIEQVGYSFSGQSVNVSAKGAFRPLNPALGKLNSALDVLCALAGSGKALIVSARNPG